MVRAAGLTALLLLSACGDESGNDLQKEALEQQIHALQTRIEALEGRTRPYATLKPSDKTFTWLDAGPNQVAVSLSGIEAQGNGSRVNVVITNPNDIGQRDCSSTITWGETAADGANQPGQTRKMPLGESLVGVALVKLDLSDIPPDRLGYITLSSIECQRLAFSGM